MTTIVRNNYPASRPPDDVRIGIDDGLNLPFGMAVVGPIGSEPAMLAEQL